MSIAKKCDKCGSLFESKHGSLTLDVSIKTRKKTKNGDQIDDTWSDVDFCPKCSASILALIGPALNGLAETLRK